MHAGVVILRVLWYNRRLERGDNMKTNSDNTLFIKCLPEDGSVDTWLSILEHNSVVANDLSKKCKILEQMKEEILLSKEEAVFEDPELLEEEEIEEKEDNDDLYDLYCEPILKIENDISYEELVETLAAILPNSNNKNFYQIIGKIQLELFNTCKEFKELLDLESGSVSQREIEEIKALISFTELKSTCIKNYVINSNRDKNNIRSVQKNNHLIFLTSSSNNLYVINDLLSIPQDYYESFLDLFESIIDGSFRRIKRFRNINDELNGVSEVRNFKTRIVFDRIGPNSFQIIDVFIKKSDNDKGYQEPLRNRVKVFKSNRKNAVALAKNEEYLKEQDQITENILNILKSKNRDKIRMIKGCDHEQ